MIIGNSFIAQSSQISKFRVARSLQVLSQSKYTSQCRNMYSSFLSLLLLVFLFPRISNLFSPPILLEHIITKGNSRANHLSEEQVVESKFRTVCYFTARLCFSLIFWFLKVYLFLHQCTLKHHYWKNIERHGLK